MILKTIKNIFKFFALASLSTALIIQPVYADNSDSYVSVNVLNTVYYGTLEENSDKTTTFTTLPDSDKQFTITGKWNESTSSFSDKCIITYDDNSTQDVFIRMLMYTVILLLIFLMVLIKLSRHYTAALIRHWKLFHLTDSWLILTGIINVHLCLTGIKQLKLLITML